MTRIRRMKWVKVQVYVFVFVLRLGECGWRVHTVVGEPGGGWEAGRVRVTGTDCGRWTWRWLGGGKSADDRYRLWSGNLEVAGRREECGWPVQTVVGEPGGGWEAEECGWLVQTVVGEPGGGWEAGKAGDRYILWSGNLQVAGRREECGWPENLAVRVHFENTVQKILILRLKVMGYDTVESDSSRTGKRLGASHEEQRY